MEAWIIKWAAVAAWGILLFILVMAVPVGAYMAWSLWKSVRPNRRRILHPHCASGLPSDGAERRGRAKAAEADFSQRMGPPPRPSGFVKLTEARPAVVRMRPPPPAQTTAQRRRAPEKRKSLEESWARPEDLYNNAANAYVPAREVAHQNDAFVSGGGGEFSGGGASGSWDSGSSSSSDSSSSSSSSSGSE